MIDEYWTWAFYGYHSDELKPKSTKKIVVMCDVCCRYRVVSMGAYRDLCISCARRGGVLPVELPEPMLCECGCGEYASRGKRFISGHNQRGKKHSPESIAKMCGKECTAKRRAAISKAHLRDNVPLPDGWKYKLSDITDNKDSPVYLGSISEIILSNIYKNVRVMPYGNHGYDFICGKGYKIDVKSSATGDKRGHWIFGIDKNKIADYFLCIAFNSRSDLRNPMHLWLIPGRNVSHKIGICISKSTVDKWNEYRLSIDEVVACCNTVKNGDNI